MSLEHTNSMNIGDTLVVVALYEDGDGVVKAEDGTLYRIEEATKWLKRHNIQASPEGSTLV